MIVPQNYRSVACGLLFPTGETQPVNIDVGLHDSSRDGSPAGRIDFLPWVGGYLDASAAGYSVVEQKIDIVGVESYTFVIVALDQRHPVALSHPSNQSTLKLVDGFDVEYRGNLLVMRREGDKFVDMEDAHTYLAKDALIE